MCTDMVAIIIAHRPWPREISQNEGVRMASLAVKSGASPPVTRAAGPAAGTPDGGSPSGRRPYSSGEFRMNLLMGQAMARKTMPMPREVTSQPWWSGFTAHARMGTRAMPPMK